MDDSELSDTEKQKILEEFLAKFENLDDLNLEYSKIVNKNFWDLLYT